MKMLPLAREIWEAKYRFAENGERDIRASWRRVAGAVAAPEADSARWRAAFERILDGFRFLPGGRILAGAGTGRDVTLFNCFVAGPVVDSIDGILRSLHETAVTMQQGGGVGLDFSRLRPAGTAAVRTGRVASGPVTFLHIWDALCATLLSTSTRRGAMMATLRCDHPDIQGFINAKRDPTSLRNFNLSVLINDDFMRAVDADDRWHFHFAADPGGNSGSMPARDLWRELCEAAHATAEPGVLFVDTINRSNNLRYCESISATNPCGEIPLPPFGACDLGSLNLVRFVEAPFTRRSRLDIESLAGCVPQAVRFLDNVIDISRFPLEAQAEQARRTRRVGLGFTGLADTLAMLGLRYDSDEARALAAAALEAIRDAAYGASVDLAREKGAFPALERDRYLGAPFVSNLPGWLRDRIAAHGIRNSHLLAIAPAGSISLLAGNVSSGIEPIYALEARRCVRDRTLAVREYPARDPAYAAWLAIAPDGADVPDAFVTAEALPARAHLEMQARLQPFVDNAISKTVTLPPEAGPDDVSRLFREAFTLGLKGCTVFRAGGCRGEVISACDA